MEKYPIGEIHLLPHRWPAHLVTSTFFVGMLLFVMIAFGSFDVVMQLSLGIVTGFLIIPLHEVIHYLGYRFFGYEDVSYIIDSKKFYCGVTVKGKVTRRDLIIIALMPIAMVCFLSVSMGWLFGKWMPFFLGVAVSQFELSKSDIILALFLMDNASIRYIADDMENHEIKFYYEDNQL